MADDFPRYDVFINHRGPDTKRTLASLIYRDLTEHGLRVFLDEKKLQVGDPFPAEILKAIRSASVQIAIFSKTYAESVWCLDELLWMLKSNPSQIIPIFYDIQPRDLRSVDKGPFARAFQNHRNKGREQVESWIDALKKVADITGVVFDTENDNYGDRLKQIVEEVLKKVGKKQLYVCDHPVGLLQAAANFETEILCPSGTNVVGIVGLGGTGKSTLAKHLYNCKCTQFERSCFLSVSTRDLASLQQTLLRDLLRDQSLCVPDVPNGITYLKDRLRGLIVLIVFDDINDRDQRESLLCVKSVVGNGSLILVTSKDGPLLESREIPTYDVKLLGPRDAQELFCWYAFGHTEPVHALQHMVEELAKLCGGFPLVLILLAERLVNERDPCRWTKHLKSLSKRLPEDILEQTVINSYDSLAVRLKDAFLDVAHFLMGEDRDLVEKVLDGLNDDDGIQCLRMLHRKCLVVQSENRSSGIWRREKGSFKIRMHDLVRDYARQIGRQELPFRLCYGNDKWISAWDSGSHGSAQQYDVRGIRIDEDHPLPEYLQNKDICNIKLLALHNFKILENFNSVSGDLTWLRLGQFEDSLNPYPLSRYPPFSWSGLRSIPSTQCRLRNFPSTLSLRSLRVLELHGVRPQDFCNLFDDREPPSDLRALEVACTRDFESARTAGPSTVISTKQGSTSGTSASLQSPIGQWFQAWLAKLNFRNLYKIVLQNIPGLKTLPINFEEVRNLRHVDLSGCSDLEVLPDSFTEELLQLQYLALRYCTKLVLQDLGKISTLEYLNFEGCSMLREMPKGTELQKSLKHLNVVHTELRELPHNLEQLEALEELLIGSSELTEMPSSLYNLSRLRDLTLLGCTELHIDNSIERLVDLESFRIYNCGLRALPETIAFMNLKILDVRSCPLDLEQLLTGYMQLDSSQAQGSTGQSAHQNPSGCLSDLIIIDSHISKILRAESLFPELEIVDLSGNRLLTEIGRLPGNLISLKLTNCSNLRTLACLSNLARLQVFDISGCDELRSVNVEGLRSIQVIKAEGCWKLCKFQGLDQLNKLSFFQFSFCPSPSPPLWYYKSDPDRLLADRKLDGYRVLEKFEYSRTASVDIKKCYFTDVKPGGAILLLFLADPDCRIKIAFPGHTYTTYTGANKNPTRHILMWSKNSEVFNDFQLSNDEAIHLKFNENGPTSGMLCGWIIEVLDRHVFTPFLNVFIGEFISKEDYVARWNSVKSLIRG